MESACSPYSPGPGSLGIHTSSKLKCTQGNQFKKLQNKGDFRKWERWVRAEVFWKVHGGHETCIGDEWDFSKEKGTNELVTGGESSLSRKVQKWVGPWSLRKMMSPWGVRKWELWLLRFCQPSKHFYDFKTGIPICLGVIHNTQHPISSWYQ